MATDVHATKLLIPPVPRQPVERTGLAQALDTAVQACRLVLVTAPAGYGKTTLLAQWARGSDLPVAWLTIERGDNDHERFLRSLVLAWAKADPAIRESAPYQLVSGMSPDPDTVVSAIIEAGERSTAGISFVLDDAHLIQDDGVRASLTSLLDHLPAGMHFVLSGRQAPRLPIARYRARGQLAEFDIDTLRFSTDETRAFLEQRLGRSLRDEEVGHLETSLEGWAAGLQLVSVSRRTPDHVPDLHSVTGKHRFIADYLREDVLDWLPDDVRAFLLQTSILDRLCASLCDAVLDRDDGQAMLERLERENLFVVPLDDERVWYRYHRLFADVLQQELQRTSAHIVPELHRRAAAWLLEHDAPEPALHHAVAADDDELGYRLFDRYANDMLNTGQVNILRSWLQTIPATWRERQPLIGLADAGVALFTGAFDTGIERLADVERRLRESRSDAWRLARVTAIRCFVACMSQDLEHAESYGFEALKDLRVDDVAYRVDIFQALGETYRSYGKWDDARAAYLRALESGTRETAPARAVHVYGGLADLELMRGHLRKAFDYWGQALAAIRKPESQGYVPLPVIGWVRLRLGELLYERNDLAAAREHLALGAESAGLGGDLLAEIASAVLMARLRITEGDLAAAQETLDAARPLLESGNYPDWAARFERCQVEIWLAQGRLHLATRWADDVLEGEPTIRHLDPEIMRLTVSRILLARGDAGSVERAMTLLGDVLTSATAMGKGGVRIEALAMRAMLQHRAGQDAAAMRSLEEALRLAEPEGYMRLFADLGVPMAHVLRDARTRHVMPAYVDSLLEMFGVPATSRVGEGVSLPEPLSPREMDVLRLMAAGLTNSEIAETLFISPETVKKHSGSIYGKLGVANRTGAAARARELGLLEDR